MSETRTRIRNKDIMWVLDITTNVCSEFARQQREWNADALYFKIPSETDYHSTDGRFSAALLQCIYLLIPHSGDARILQEKAEKLEFLVADSDKLHSKPLVIDITQKNIRSIRYDGLINAHGDYLEELISRVDGSFLPPDKIAFFKENLQDFLDKRKKLAQCHCPFPEYEIMDSYLQCYYRLLSFVLLNEQTVRVLGSDMLHMLLQLDCADDSVSLLSPMAMNRMRRMYLGIEEYYKKILKDKNEVMDFFDKSVISQKVRQSFRWFGNGTDGELIHIAVASYSNDEDAEPKDLDLKVMRADIHRYNSYEGIGELRIAEKILYELDKYLGMFEEPLRPFRIAVLGDVNRKPMEELAGYLDGVFQSRENSFQPKLSFDIYTKNDVGNSDASCDTKFEMNYYDNLDEVFTNKELLCQLLREHEAIFMMDCVKLYYEMDCVPEVSSGYLKQRFAFGNALDNATDDKVDICCPNLLDKLYELMTVYDRRGELGVFSKRANDSLLRFCEEQINLTQDDYHALYVYVSDLGAFNSIYCNDKCYMRTERYNQKEIGIIRYTNRITEKLNFPVSSQKGEKILCFNAWQIVKHISLENRKGIIEKMMEMIGCSSEGTVNDYDLHRMYIGMDYSDWPKRLTLHYAVVGGFKQQTSKDAEIQEMFLKTFASQIVKPIFDGERSGLFQQYFWKTIYSLLYGAAKNVEEMLLIYLLHDKASIVGKMRMADKNNADAVKRNINRDYKYSIKRFVAMIISQFDISASGALDQMWVAYIINKSDEAVKPEDKLFHKVRTACENMGYQDSYLYRNCMNTE